MDCYDGRYYLVKSGKICLNSEQLERFKHREDSYEIMFLLCAKKESRVVFESMDSNGERERLDFSAPETFLELDAQQSYDAKFREGIHRKLHDWFPDVGIVDIDYSFLFNDPEGRLIMPTLWIKFSCFKLCGEPFKTWNRIKVFNYTTNHPDVVVAVRSRSINIIDIVALAVVREFNKYMLGEEK